MENISDSSKLAPVLRRVERREVSDGLLSLKRGNSYSQPIKSRIAMLVLRIVPRFSDFGMRTRRTWLTAKHGPHPATKVSYVRVGRKLVLGSSLDTLLFGCLSMSRCIGNRCRIWDRAEAFRYVLFALARHRFLAITVVIEGVLNVVLSVILVPRIGLLGVGLGTLIPLFITKVIVQPIYVCHVFGLPYEDYFWTVARTMAKIMLACVIPFLLIIKFAVPSYLVLIVLGAVTAILYGLPLAVTVFDTRESQLLIRTLAVPASASGKMRTS